MTLKQSTKQIVNSMIDNHGFLFCQHCNRSDGPLSPPHHIIFKSERPGHPELHNVRNLILLCFECHDKFHGKIKGFTKHGMRKELIVERNLNKLFGD